MTTGAEFTRPTLAWLAGGGEMGELIRATDWSATPLGPIAAWPPSLRSSVSLCLASNSPIDIIWGRGRVQIYNDGYRPICGDKHPQSMGQDFKECWLSAWPVIGEPFERALEGDGRSAYIENQRLFIDRNGYLEETFFTFSFSAIRDESGDIAGLFHPVTEVTQQMLAERRLQLLRDVADSVRDAKTAREACALIARTLAAGDLDVPFALLYLVDREGAQATLAGSTGLEPGSGASPRLVSLTNESPNDWPLAAAIASESPLIVDDIVGRFGSLSCGPYPEPLANAVLLSLRSPGRERPLAILVAGVSCRRELDRPYHIFYEMLRDTVSIALTNARAYEEERKRAEALAMLDRAKTAFFSNVSHEFRTPLTLILGPLEEVLQDPAPFPAATRAGLEIVHRNATRLLGLVNTLLDFSRIEAGRVEASYEPTDLASLTTELSGVFRSAIERAGLRLTVECPPLREPVWVDREMWEKIVFNLLSNALKFTFEGTIDVSLRQVGNTVQLTVRDTGTGIPADELPRVFERFHRVRGARGRTFEGSGIGLALVAEMARLHGGAASADSTLDQGSTFAVTIPLGHDHLPTDRIGTPPTGARPSDRSRVHLAEALHWLPDGENARDDVPGAASFSSQATSARPSTASPRRSILVVDDNGDMRDYVAGLLGSRYQVVTAADGLAALDAARRSPPDLVLTDVMMPRLDGFGLIAELRADDRLKTIPVIMLSARAGEESRVEGLEAGADDYLVKPFSARELVARVESHLTLDDLRRDERALREREDRLAATLQAEAERDTLRQRLSQAEEDERRRLARELHDELGQHITALGLGLQGLCDVSPPGSEVDRRVDRLRTLVDTMSRELHSVAVRLRPRALDDFGLEVAVAAYAEEWSERTGIAIDVNARLDFHRLGDAVESALYRIVQEALTNVAKHSGATRASILIEWRNGHVVAVIEDDGRGFDAADDSVGHVRAGGLGLLGIGERAALFGGTVDVDAAPGAGTTLFVRIPIEASHYEGRPTHT